MNEQVIQRVPIGKRLRFEVLRRDKFTCLYCGKSSPNVILEVDHVVPVVDGGTNDLQNLATSCFECNRGKSTKPVGVFNVETMPSFEQMELHRIQVEEFIEYTKFVKESQDQLALEVWRIFGYSRAVDSRITSGIISQIKSIGFEETVHVAHISASRKDGDLWNRYMYFCGVCRNKSGVKNEKT